MKNLRRRIIYTSFHAEADFLAYYDKMGNFVSLVVNMPKHDFHNEEVDAETFRILLNKVKAFDDSFPELYKNIRKHSFAGLAHDAVLPSANFHQIMVNAYGYHERRHC